MAPIREKRLKFEHDKKLLREIILDGSKKAQIKAQETIDKVEEAVKMYK